MRNIRYYICSVLILSSLCAHAYAYYHPDQGRWINRDPVGEQGGLNQYGFVGNAPPVRWDKLGLDWEIIRDGDRQAVARGECDDEVLELAQTIGLDHRVYSRWLVSTDGQPLPLSSIEPLWRDRVFLIPNTVYAYWAGNLSTVGKSIVSWNANVNYLRNRGFYVDDRDHTRGYGQILQYKLMAASNRKELHGLYYWGHGVFPRRLPPFTGKSLGLGTSPWYGFASPIIPADGEWNVKYSTTRLNYKMALGLVFACDSNNGASVLHSGTDGSIWWGDTGLLWPLFWWLYDVDDYIHPEDQGTRL